MAFLDRLRSEFIYLRAAIRILGKVSPIVRNRTRIFPDILDELAERFSDNVALLNDRESLTYRELLLRSNQYAHWAKSVGIGKGDTVALMMRNRPEYLAVWMGIIRVGGVCALVNTHLTGSGLAHCLNIVGASQIIVGDDMMDAYGSAADALADPPRLWTYGDADATADDLDAALSALPTDPVPPDDLPELTIDDPALYIYTSGTTGLPKAAVINHYRVQAIMAGFAAACSSGPQDRIYVAQPLYHTAGGVLAPGIVLMNGGSCFIREKFSASQFWDDVVTYECTMFQYIGELCRYLLNAPPHPNETKHRIRACNGNGLRPDIWMAFKERFRIPRIIEWYAATEGNVTLFNLDGTPGAVGRIPWWLESRFMTKIIRYDVEADQVVRGGDGYCIACEPGEVGEAIGRILIDPKAPAQRFDGYADRSATEKKILRGVFEPDDAWFRTGDLLKKDAHGYFYFIDRIGDTYRWKGENVSTSEVAEAINVFDGVRETTVYGVEIAGQDGRAGMVAIAADETLDLAGLAEHIRGSLPVYARPLFVRIRHEIDATGTFKQKKVDLRSDGFDPARVGDDLFFSNPETNRFEPLDKTLYERIQAGEIRL